MNEPKVRVRFQARPMPVTPHRHDSPWVDVAIVAWSIFALLAVYVLATTLP